ncbi:MAG: DUF5372 family protein [Solirubrobacteraceae bacterium]
MAGGSGVRARRRWRVGLVAAKGTDAVPTDRFVVVSAGRPPFHVTGLLELAKLVERRARR